MVRRGLFFLLLFVSVAASQRAAAQQETGSCLELGGIDSGFVRTIGDSLVRLLAEKGVCLEVRYLPGNRLRRDVQAGALKGEIFRGPLYIQSLDGDFVTVGPPILRSYATLVQMREKTASAPAANYYGRMGGAAWAERYVAPGARLISYQRLDQAFDLLRIGRLTGFYTTDDLMRFSAIDPAAFRVQRLERLDAYLYLRSDLTRIRESLEMIFLDAAGGRESLDHIFEIPLYDTAPAAPNTDPDVAAH